MFIRKTAPWGGFLFKDQYLSSLWILSAAAADVGDHTVGFVHHPLVAVGYRKFLRFPFDFGVYDGVVFIFLVCEGIALILHRHIGGNQNEAYAGMVRPVLLASMVGEGIKIAVATQYAANSFAAAFFSCSVISSLFARHAPYIVVLLGAPRCLRQLYYHVGQYISVSTRIGYGLYHFHFAAARKLS